MLIQPEDFHPSSFNSSAKYRLKLRLDESLSLPVLLARGARGGRTLVTTANIHGDEYEGVRAIFEVFDELDTGEMSGNWLAVPVANPPAFWNASRTSPIHCVKLARAFPGAAPAGNRKSRRGTAGDSGRLSDPARPVAGESLRRPTAWDFGEYAGRSSGGIHSAG